MLDLARRFLRLMVDDATSFHCSACHNADESRPFLRVALPRPALSPPRSSQTETASHHLLGGKDADDDGIVSLSHRHSTQAHVHTLHKVNPNRSLAHMAKENPLARTLDTQARCGVALPCVDFSTQARREAGGMGSSTCFAAFEPHIAIRPPHTAPAAAKFV